MPFGLKNVGATYQRMMSSIFEPLLGKTMEAYIDNMLMDPTRSTGRCDSLLNEKKIRVDFRVLENPSPTRNGFALESPLTFYFYFM